VMFLFVIMLLGVDRAMDLSAGSVKVQKPLAAVMGVGLIALLTATFIKADDALQLNQGTGIDVAAETGDHDSNIRQLADNLFGDHVFAFQLTSVLLIVAVVGTVVMTRKWPKADDETREGSA
jgi:NADH-quinone oxidoreductase subunit J